MIDRYTEKPLVHMGIVQETSSIGLIPLCSPASIRANHFIRSDKKCLSCGKSKQEAMQSVSRVEVGLLAQKKPPFNFLPLLDGVAAGVG